MVGDLSKLAPDPVSALVPFSSQVEAALYRRAAAGAVALFVSAAMVTVQAGVPAAALATFLFGASVLPIGYVAQVVRSRPYAPDLGRALRLLCTAAVLVAVAAGLEAALGSDRRTAGGAAVVALLELSLQVVTIAWVVRRSPSRFRFDGVVVGATVGMGFALGQSALFAVAFADRPAELLATLGAQTLLGPLAHGAIAALAGAAIGRSRAYQPILNGTTAWAIALAVPLRLLWDVQPADGWSWAWSVAVAGAAVVLLRVTVRSGVATAMQRSACRRAGLSPLRAPAMPAAPR